MQESKERTEQRPEVTEIVPHGTTFVLRVAHAAGGAAPREVRLVWCGVVDGKRCADCVQRSKDTAGVKTLCEVHYPMHRAALRGNRRRLRRERKEHKAAGRAADGAGCVDGPETGDRSTGVPSMPLTERIAG